ncbi:MAG: lytic transglycosylase domain-containing protein [Bacteroidales bacterium]
MKNYKPPLHVYILLAFMLAAVLFIFSGFFNEKNLRSSSGTEENFSMLNFKLPDTVDFAGEKVPLENFDTRENLEREIIMTAFRHGSTIMILKKAPRYFPMIEKILEEKGIPDDFKYVAVAESELSNMVSPAGAVGFWQIMTGTGREHGLEINNEIDERYHVEKSTAVACDYFRESYERYGSWTLAAATYNGGRNAIDEQISIQKQTNYYDLLLADETARYIFRVVAYKIIMNNPVAYGFHTGKDDFYPPLRYIEVKVDTAVTDFARFAAHFGTNYKILKFHNPWLRKPYLTRKSGKAYYIKIPEEGSRINLYKQEI